MKKCFKCHASLPITEFYAHPMMGDGHLGKCKACTKKDTAARIAIKSKDPNWLIREADRQRMKQRRCRALGMATVLTPKKKLEADRRWRAKYPEKSKAHALCQRIAKKPCEICGNPKADKHHEDYAKPLEVRWLCRKHHAARHVEINRERILRKLSNKKSTP